MAWISLFLLGVVIVCLAFRLIRHLQLRRQVNRLPGPKTIPLLGNAHRFAGEPKEFIPLIEAMVSESGCWSFGFMRLWMAQYPYIFAFHADAIEPVLSSSKHITKSFDYDMMIPWLGRGLLVANGNKWTFRRKLLTPSFHFQVLSDYASVMQEKCRIFRDCLFDAADRNSEGFDISPFISRLALDIICQTAMGVCVDAQSDPNNQYLKDVIRLNEILFCRWRKPWLWNPLINYVVGAGFEELKLVKKLQQFTCGVIAERRRNIVDDANRKSSMDAANNNNNINNNKRVRLSFLDTLLSVAEEHGLTEEDIREEVDTFMFEGHDTTSTGLSWALYLIGKEDQVQRKIQAEIDQVCSEAANPEDLRQEDLRKLQYLEWSIKETLRMFPPVPFFIRKVEDEINLPGGVKIPPRTYFSVSPYLLHRNPNVWPDPENFDPERFNPENSAKRHPYAYVPFSAGPRNCIGQRFAMLEEKLALVSVFRHFNVHTIKDCWPSAQILLRAEPGVFVKLSRRYP